MAKRIYVAVGTTGVKALIELIKRHKDEGLFGKTPDRFLGIDTDNANTDGIKKLNEIDPTGQIARGFALVSGKPSLHAFTRKFRPEWGGALDIPASGVGGDGRLSRSTLCFADNDNGANLDRYFTDNTVEEVVLIGSAFGGTATGSFWNITGWIRSLLPKKPGSPTESIADFYAMILLPAGRSGSGQYPTYKNFCFFLQEMNVRYLADRLAQHAIMDIPFMVPQYNFYSESEKKLKVWRPETDGMSAHSYLPFDRVFLVPTPDGMDGPSWLPRIAAEQLFVLGGLEGWSHLNITSKIIDAHRHILNTGPEAKDASFAGFENIAVLSGRGQVLSREVYNQLKQQFSIFWPAELDLSVFRKMEGAPAPEWLDKYMQDCVEAYPPGTAPLSDDIVRWKEELVALALKNDRVALFEKLGQVQRQCSLSPFTWLSLLTILEQLGQKPAGVQHTEADKLPYTMGDVVTAVGSKAKWIKDRAARKEAVSQLIQELPTRMEGVIRQRVKKGHNALAVGALSCKDAVIAEIRGQAKDRLERLFDEYIDACRAHATLALMPVTSPELDTLKKVRKEIGASLLEGGVFEGKALPTCLIESGAQNDVNLPFPKLKGASFYEAIIQIVTDKESPTRERHIQKCVEDGVEQLRADSQRLYLANPLRSLTVKLDTRPPSRALKAFSGNFRLSAIGQPCEKGFWYSYGSCEPVTWGQLGDVADFFKMLRQNQGRDPGEIIEPMAIGGDDYFRAKKMDSETLQGMWIGTVKYNCTLSDILLEEYKQQMATYVSAASEEARKKPAALLSLPETIAWGCLLGCLQEKFRAWSKAQSDGMPRFRIRIGVPSMEVLETQVFESIHVDEYFPRKGEERELAAIMVDWVEPLQRWFKASFWSQLNLEAEKTRLESMDMSSPSRMDMNIPKQLEADLRSVITALRPVVSIETAYPS